MFYFTGQRQAVYRSGINQEEIQPGSKEKDCFVIDEFSIQLVNANFSLLSFLLTLR